MQKKWLVGLSVVVAVAVVSAVGVYVVRGKQQQVSSPATTGKVMLIVQNEAQNVTAEQVKHVQDLLVQGDVLHKIATPYGLEFKLPVTVHLAGDEENYTKLLSDYYAKALQGENLNDKQAVEVQQYVNDMGKFESAWIQGDIFLNMKKINQDAKVRQDVVPLLTQVLFTQNDVLLPYWVSDGLATRALYEEMYQGDTQALTKKKEQNIASVLKSQQAGETMVLSTNGSLNTDDQYDVAALNWMATDQLLQQQGVEKVMQFVRESQSSSKVVDPFDHVFGEEESLYKMNFFAQLADQAKQSKK